MKNNKDRQLNISFSQSDSKQEHQIRQKEKAQFKSTNIISFCNKKAEKDRAEDSRIFSEIAKLAKNFK